MKDKLLEGFLENTEKLALLAEIRLESTYADFTRSIMVAFEKVKSGDEISNFLIELFLTPISNQLVAEPSLSEGTLDPFARSFFASCSVFFETSLRAYFSLSNGNSLVTPALLGQYREYLLELQQREEERTRRQQEEQLRQFELARKQEEEQFRRQQEEQLRQSEQARKQEREQIRLQRKENKAARLEWLKSRARQLSFILCLGIPLLMQGLVFYRKYASWDPKLSWDPELNEDVTTFTAYGVTAFACYVICAIALIRFTVNLKEEIDQEGEVTGLWVFIFMIYQANSFWPDILNHTKIVLVISICVVPFIPFFRVATALYSAGKIGAVVQK
jgi:hypothetical protein